MLLMSLRVGGVADRLRRVGNSLPGGFPARPDADGGGGVRPRSTGLTGARLRVSLPAAPRPRPCPGPAPVRSGPRRHAAGTAGRRPLTPPRAAPTPAVAAPPRRP